MKTHPGDQGIESTITALVLAAAFRLISPNTATAQETFDWSGAWHGTIEAPTGDVRVGFSFSTDGTGALEGRLKPRPSPRRVFALEEITVDGNAIVFEVPVIGAAYDGVWDARTDTISGTFRQSGMDIHPDSVHLPSSRR